MYLSIVVPVYNEEQNIAPLIQEIAKSLSNLSYEIIFVDDGSGDNTVNEIRKFKNHNVKLVKFTRNFGQTSAMAAGIEAAEGEFLAFLDGDLQNDPSDIPMMLEKLNTENLDMIAGRRAKRKDGLFLRKIPSKIANKLIYSVSKLEIKDYGCTLKLMRTRLAKELDLYGELHRFIPILAAINGAKIAEVDVKHHPRRFGVSKYGLSRTLKVASDLLLMAFFIKYRQKPMHLFGSMGLMSLLVGGAISFYLAIEKFLLGNDIGTRPMFFAAILLIIAGIQLISTGFIAELLMRTYFSSKQSKPYSIDFIEKI